MRCPACGRDNPGGAGFCVGCGARLSRPVVCPRCETALPPDAAFCFRCGAALEVSPPSPASAALPGSFIQGRYAVLRLLAEDGATRVYLAHDREEDRDVALTIIADAGRRGEWETGALAELGNHPHIAAVYDSGSDGGCRYTVGELQTDDLATRIARAPDRRLPLELVLRVAGQVCQALAHAHERRIVHGALRPANVWLASDGAAKVGGFGMLLGGGNATRGGLASAAGTVSYIAPEQALGQAADARADLYALGALLYELVTGRPPFLGDDPVTVISQHIDTTPVAPSWHNPYVPKPLEALILRLLAKDPADRPESAAVVELELAAVSVVSGSPYRVSAASQQEAGTVNPLDRLASGVFVGREFELGRLRAAFDGARAGRAGIVLLAGEPGIGKTTLAEETATYARLHGAQVFWGRCYEWEGAPAYWPWVQIVRAYVGQQPDANRLRHELGPGAADIAQVVPEVRERLPDLPQLPRMEGEQARFRLFDSIARFLRAAAPREPLLLVLDDLHWADAPSLLLLQFLARELEDAHLLIVGTYRDAEVGRHHPLAATLAELARGHGTPRLALHGLTSADIARFIVLSTGVEPEAGLVDAVRRETEGNPFFVSEVVRLLAAEGRFGRTRASGPASLSIGIPESVRDVIGRRLDRLSPSCNELLAVASVIGREFTVPLLERVSGLPSDTVLDALEEAVRARLVDEELPALRYRFTHALVQDTLYAEVSAGRRLRLHAAAGAALEHIHAHDLAPYYGELAHHYGVAAPGGSAAKAVDYAVKAGDRALAQVAWETAIQHYERALHALDLQAEPDPAQRCDVLLALGSAQYHTVLDISESPGGQQAFLRAAEIATAIGSFERLARAALGFAGINAVRTSGGMQQVQLLEAALALAPPEDSALKARVMARLAVDIRVVNHASGRIRTLSDDALAMARRIDDPGVLAYVLVARHSAIWGPDTAEERIAVVEEAREAAEAAGDVYCLVWSRLFCAYDLYEVGDHHRFEQEYEGSNEAARQSRIPYFLWVSEIYEVGSAIKAGRFADAEPLVPRLGGSSQALVAIYAKACMSFLLRREQGRLAELLAPLQTVIDLADATVDLFDRHRGHIARAMLMLAHLDAGRTADARASFDAFIGHVVNDLPKDPYWLATVTLMAEVCAALDDRAHATALYDMLLPYAHRNANPASGAIYLGSVSHYLGLLAHLLARWQDASRHFEQAVAMNAHMRARPALARTYVAYAEMLAGRDVAGNRRRILDLLNEARVIIDEVGLARLAQRAGHLAARLGQPMSGSAPVGMPYGLTPRELDVLRLIVAGKADREIAEALFISPRTVTTHVSNIFNKLGLNTRAEAAAFAVRHALV